MKLINTIILLQVFFLIGCSNIRNKMTFYPDTKYEINKENFPLFASELIIKTSDQEKLQAFYFTHRDTSNHSLVIYFHGNAGNLYGRFEYAEKLYKMNHNVLLVSYRGYAKSTGKPNEKGIYIDGESAVKFAIDSLGYSMENITIIGRSLGSTVAINTAQEKKIKGVILISPLTSGKEVVRASGMKTFAFIAGKSYNSIDKINNLKTPILIIHGTNDEVIPYSMGKSLFNTYQGIKHFVPIEKGKHNNLEIVNPELFWGEIEKFLSNNRSATTK